MCFAEEHVDVLMGALLAVLETLGPVDPSAARTQT